jgi:hypothetical protein
MNSNMCARLVNYHHFQCRMSYEYMYGYSPIYVMREFCAVIKFGHNTKKFGHNT